jgi:hypothetical protein
MAIWEMQRRHLQQKSTRQQVHKNVRWSEIKLKVRISKGIQKCCRLARISSGQMVLPITTLPYIFYPWFGEAEVAIEYERILRFEFSSIKCWNFAEEVRSTSA